MALAKIASILHPLQIEGSDKVATYRQVYRPEPKEPPNFVSCIGSEIQNLPICLSGIVSLYREEPQIQAYLNLYLVRRSKIIVSVATLGSDKFWRRFQFSY